MSAPRANGQQNLISPLPVTSSPSGRNRLGRFFKSVASAVASQMVEPGYSINPVRPARSGIGPHPESHHRTASMRFEEELAHSNASQRFQSSDSRPGQPQTVQSTRRRGRNPYEALEAHHRSELMWRENSTHSDASSQYPRSSELYLTAPQPLEEDSSLIRVTFSPAGKSSIVGHPDSISVTPTPLYHISWYEDYFLPGSFITTIHRGGNNQGSVVGNFDLKGNKKAAIVHFGSEWRWLDDALSFSKHQHRWQFGSNVLYWSRSPASDSTGIILSCKLIEHSRSKDDIIAKFICPSDQLPRAGLYRSCQLVVSREHGPFLLDEILLSAFIIESKYLNPKFIWAPH